jgi:hypothetical protein
LTTLSQFPIRLPLMTPPWPATSTNASRNSGKANSRRCKSLAVHRRDLRPGGKGYEKDIVAVLGLVSDFDDEDAPRWAERLPIPPNYVIETSADRFQASYLFDRPCSVAEAKPIAERLKDFARCDHGTIDLSHVWRIPGALNWPNVKKIAGGRPREPQVARVVLPWNGTRPALADLAAALPGQLPELDALDRSNGATGPVQRFAEPVPSVEMISLLVKALPDNLQKLITEPSDDRSKAIFSTVKELNKRGFDRGIIRRIIQVHPRGIGAKHVGRNDLDLDIDRILSKISKLSRTEAVQQVRNERASLNRPIVKVIGGDLVEVINQAERYLVIADVALFQRGDFIVRPAPVIIEIADGQQVTGLRLVTVRHHHLVERFTAVVDFVRFDARSKEWVSINCPAQVAHAYLERIGHWRLPHLTGLTTCPTLRPDGSILDAPGYDHLTGIYFDPRGVAFPPIPQRHIDIIMRLDSQIGDDPDRSFYLADLDMRQDWPQRQSALPVFGSTWSGSSPKAAMTSLPRSASEPARP